MPADASMTYLPRHIAVAALLAAITLSGCTRKDVPPPPEKITIAYSTSSYAVLAVVATVQGYFRDEGLDVTIRRHTFGKPALDDVIQGKADFATVGETPFMFAVMNGHKLSILATIQNDGKNHAIIARADRGIRTVSDLKGKKIGTTFGTTAHFFMDSFLASYAISRKDVTVVNLAPEELVLELVEGRIDAATAFEPFSVTMESRLGKTVTVFRDDDIYTLTFNIVSSRDYINTHPETARKVLRALLKAEEFVKRDPVAAQKIVADFGGLDLKLIRQAWREGVNYEVALDQSLLLALEDETQWALAQHVTSVTTMPNYLDYIYLDGLSSVKPGAVRILR